MPELDTPGSAEQPIVAAVDGSEISYRAVAWAAAEAELWHWPLHIVVAYGLALGRETHTSLGTAEMKALRAETARVLAEAERVARSAAGDTIAVTTEAIDELALPALLSRSTTARMMVVGNRGRGAVRRAILGSVSTGLSRYARCPVVVVPGAAEVGRAALSKPVVVGVDGTRNSLPAVRTAFEEASQRKVSLIAVHAGSDSSGYDLPAGGWERVRPTKDALLREALAEISEEFAEVTVEQHVAYDTPVRALLEYAAGAQLLVVGSHGRSGFEGMVLGSVSTALLHLAECPVLIVRSREQAGQAAKASQ